MTAFTTPILLLIFNRPDTTAQVFQEIRKQQPKYLYVAADGPRDGVESDAELCRQARAVALNIDWDCEVKTLLREQNLGCGVAPAQAITWFFEHVEQGIILEDDILPDQTFFPYCEQMLAHFKHDERVMHISGCYFLTDLITAPAVSSYYFTRHIHVWGWATWRRAWQLYSYDMKGWEMAKTPEQLVQYYGDHYIFWQNIFARMQFKGNDIWDYQWMFAIYKNNGVAINPTVNLTKNIGFNNNATHTTNTDSIFTRVELASSSVIKHPEEMQISTDKDLLYYKYYLDFDLQEELRKTKLSWKLKNILKRLKKRFLAILK